MAVALRFGIVILKSDWTGQAPCVDSDLNGFGEVTEARMLKFSVRRCILQEEKTFFKQFKKPLISFCNPRELMA